MNEQTRIEQTISNIEAMGIDYLEDNIPVASVDGISYDKGIVVRNDLTLKRKRTILDHELMHHKYNLFYNPFSPLETKSRIENKVNTLVCIKYKLKARLEAYFETNKGKELWEICEDLNEEPEIIKFAIYKYFGKEL